MPSKKPFTNKHLNPKNIYELKRLLLDKYQNIIGEHEDTQLSIEEIVEYVVHYYESIIYCMPGNVYWLDKHGTALGCNKNVLNMFGLKSLTQFKNLTFEEMGKIGSWSLEATQSFKKDTLEVTYTGKAKLNIEEPIIPNSDGKLIHFLTSRVPLFDNVGLLLLLLVFQLILLIVKIWKKHCKKPKKKLMLLIMPKPNSLKTCATIFVLP